MKIEALDIAVSPSSADEVRADRFAAPLMSTLSLTY